MAVLSYIVLPNVMGCAITMSLLSGNTEMTTCTRKFCVHTCLTPGISFAASYAGF